MGFSISSLYLATKAKLSTRAPEATNNKALLDRAVRPHGLAGVGTRPQHGLLGGHVHVVPALGKSPQTDLVLFLHDIQGVWVLLQIVLQLLESLFGLRFGLLLELRLGNELAMTTWALHTITTKHTST